MIVDYEFEYLRFIIEILIINRKSKNHKLKLNFRSFFRTGGSLELRFRGETEHSGNEVFGE